MSSVVPSKELQMCVVRAQPSGCRKSVVNHILQNEITYHKLSPEDIIGKDFETLEDAEAFYYAYGKVLGFDVRKYEKIISVKTGRVTIRQLVCSSEGKRQNKYLKNIDRVRIPRKETRCYCPCLFKVSYFQDSNSYVAVKFITDHSHALAPAHMSHLLRSHRYISESQLKLAKSMRKACIKTCHVYKYIANKAGGYSNVPFTAKDLYNMMGSSRQKILLHGDVHATIAYLEEREATNNKLFYKYNIDEHNRLANLFWRDSNSFVDYCCFRDVLVFDSTYKTNHYGKPLVLFVGSNNHLMTTIFGFALLVNEKIETYTWVPQMFLESMEGKKPIAVLTDGDEAMRKAIDVVLLGCLHRLCTWHISRNARGQLSNNKLLAEFRGCMFNEVTPYGFEKRWNDMVNNFGLHDKTWVQMMYEKRQKWAEAFVSGKFLARMRSTQRCEGMNSFIKDFLTNGVKLFELIPSLDQALSRLRNNVLEEDF